MKNTIITFSTLFALVLLTPARASTVDDVLDQSSIFADDHGSRSFASNFCDLPEDSSKDDFLLPEGRGLQNNKHKSEPDRLSEGRGRQHNKGKRFKAMHKSRLDLREMFEGHHGEGSNYFDDDWKARDWKAHRDHFRCKASSARHSDGKHGGDCGHGGMKPPEVPLPAAVWLFGSGLLGLVGIARRRRH